MSETLRSSAEVRRATSDDAAEIARLLDAFNREFDSPTLALSSLEENVRRQLSEDGLVALLAGAPAEGLALISLRPTVWGNGPVGLLEELYVVPDRRGRGIGRRLMQETLSVARAASCVWMEVTTSEDDNEARSLYESCGFTNFEDSTGSPRMLFYELELDGDFIRPQA